MSDLLLLIIFMVLLVIILRSARHPEAAAAIATLVGAIDRRHTDSTIAIEKAKKPADK